MAISTNASPKAVRGGDVSEAQRVLSQRKLLSKQFGRSATSRTILAQAPLTKSVRFVDDVVVHTLDQSENDVRNAWITDEEKQEIRRSIDRRVDATFRRMEMRGQGRNQSDNDDDYVCRYDPLDIRGIEHLIHVDRHDEKVARGKKTRQSILRAMQMNGATAAARLSAKLTAADVKEARDKAVRDVDIAVQVYCHDTKTTLPITESKSGLFSFRKKTRSYDNLQQLIGLQAC
jgi:hypothetical protein